MSFSPEYNIEEVNHMPKEVAFSDMQYRGAKLILKAWPEAYRAPINSRSQTQIESKWNKVCRVALHASHRNKH